MANIGEASEIFGGGGDDPLVADHELPAADPAGNLKKVCF